jgi:hypothetical protein
VSRHFSERRQGLADSIDPTAVAKRNNKRKTSEPMSPPPGEDRLNKRARIEPGSDGGELSLRRSLPLVHEHSFELHRGS